MRREAGSPKILVSGNWLFQSSVSWWWPKGTWALGTRLRYFAITEFNKCFIIRSPSLFSCFNLFLAAQGSDQPFSLENVVQITHEQNIICSKTRLDSTTHEQTITCRQLFAGHVVGCWPMEGKKTLHRMIIFCCCWPTCVLLWKNQSKEKKRYSLR